MPPLDPNLDDLAGQNQQAQAPPRGLPPPQVTPFGFARAAEHQQQWPTPQGLEGLLGVGTTLGQMGTTLGQGVASFNDQMNNLFQTAMSQPGEVHPDQSAQAAAQIAWQLLGLGGGVGAARAAFGGGVKAIGEAATPGMFKFLPTSRPGYFTVLDHEDKYIADIENAYLKDPKTVKVDLYAAPDRLPKEGVSDYAKQLNRQTHTFTHEELANIARAGMQEFPGADIKTAMGGRTSGSKSLSGDPLARVGVDRLMKRYPEKFPPAPEDPEMSKELLRIAQENIAGYRANPASAPPIPLPKREQRIFGAPGRPSYSQLLAEDRSEMEARAAAAPPRTLSQQEQNLRALTEDMVRRPQPSSAERERNLRAGLRQAPQPQGPMRISTPQEIRDLENLINRLLRSPRQEP
jgi:hypothetical protein